MSPPPCYSRCCHRSSKGTDPDETELRCRTSVGISVKETDDGVSGSHKPPRAVEHVFFRIVRIGGDTAGTVLDPSCCGIELHHLVIVKTGGIGHEYSSRCVPKVDMFSFELLSIAGRSRVTVHAKGFEYRFVQFLVVLGIVHDTSHSVDGKPPAPVYATPISSVSGSSTELNAIMFSLART